MATSPQETLPSPQTDPSNTITIGTRRSALARIQTDIVLASMQKSFPQYTYKIHAMDPLGDRDKVTALYNFNAKSLWTEELEVLLESGELDCIVHSLKDMPTQLPQSLSIGAIFPREDPRDALVLRNLSQTPSSTISTTTATTASSLAKSQSAHQILSSLPAGALIGTSSLRRTAQLRRAYPHLSFDDVRGNVPTRLRKLDDPKSFLPTQTVPDFSGIIIAAAGLIRLNLQDRITALLSKDEGGCLHAVGQGAIGVEVRSGDERICGLLGELGCWKTERACLAERSLMRTLEGGCSVPIGVESEWVKEGEGEGEEGDDVLLLRAVVVSLDGSDAVEAEVENVVRTREEADALGREVARVLVERGAGDILDKITLNRKIVDEQGQA